MCGRFALSVNLGTFMDEFHISVATSTTPEIQHRPRVEYPCYQRGTKMRWGLIPHWAKDKKIGYKMINVRVETIDQKPAFKSSFLHRRCLIPADVFYVWKKLNGGKQPPMRIVLPGKVVFAFAGI